MPPASSAPALADRLAVRAAADPDAAAFVVDGGGELSCLAWERRSNALARGLLQLGVVRGDRVVLRFDPLHWLDYVIAAAGVLKVGAVAVPVAAHRSGLDLATVVGHCEAAAVVTATGGAGLDPGCPMASVDDLAEGHSDGPFSASPVDAVEILYRVGHLRPPRPTFHSEEEILAGLVEFPGRSVPAGTGLPGRSVLHSFTVGSDAARLAMWWPLGPGTPTVVALAGFDADRVCALSEARGIDAWLLAPATALLVVESGALTRHDVSSVRRVHLVGPRPPAPLLDRLIAAFGDGLVVAVPGTGQAPEAPSPPGGERRRPVSPPGSGAPRDGVAETVAAVFQRVLGVDAIGADDDFFARGGGQMAAVKALRLLEDAFDVQVTLNELVEAPTVSALAGRLEHRLSTPGHGSDPDRIAPVAFSQEGMLWQEQFVPGSQNLPPLVRRFRGELDVGALEASLHEIVRRHEPLRSRFEMRAGRLVQIVDAHQPAPLPVHDLSGLDAPGRQAELAAALAHAGRPFDLVGGPLFEPALFRLGARDHVVVFRVHHSVYDDWSVSVFRRELSALYRAFVAGAASPLPALALGFAQFARGQRRRLAGPTGAAQLAWWKSHLKGAPFCLQLPVDDPDRVEGAPQPSAKPVTVELPADLHAEVRALARRQRATPFMAVLAAFEVLVHRYTGQSDLLMASVVANRNRPELEPMIGCFTKKILLRQDMSGDPTFAEVLDRTRVSVLGALPHQDLPFETVLQETVGPAAADHGLVPYVGVMFQGVTPQVDEVVLPGVTTTGFDTSATTTRAHFAAGAEEGTDDRRPWGDGLYVGTFLILSLVETPDSASLVARGAFHGPAVERLLANFVSLLHEIVADPARRLSELRLLADDQRHQMEVWNHTGDGAPPDMGAHELFRAQAARSPSAPAVTIGSGTSSGGRAPGVASYAGLRAQADELAGRLRACGVGRGSLVGICLEPSQDCVAAVLAVWTAGAAYVALDPTDDGDHLGFVVAGAGLDVIVTWAPLGVCLPPSVRLVDVDVDVDADAGPHAALAGPGPGGAGEAAVPGDAALVFYGAGASSVPRPVVVGHRSIVNLVAGVRRGVYGPSRTGLRVCLSARPTADAFVRQLAAVLDGHSLCVPEDEGPTGVVALVAAGAVDVLDLSPEQFRALMAAGLQDALVARPPDAVTPVVVVGAREPLDRASWRSLRTLRGARVRTLYGSPGCGFAATVDDDLAASGRVTAGRPLANVTAHVLDPGGEAVPVQVTGELFVGGPGVAQGEGGDQKKAGLHDTGRRARWLPDGRIEVLGAAADAVDLRGFSVDRARLQDALIRFPGISGARVVVEPEREGRIPRLVAYVQPEDGAAIPTLAHLRVFLWRLLPGYAWPATVVAVADLDSSAGTEADERATVAEEAFLAALWAEVAGVDRVGPGENYWQSFPFLDVVVRAAEAGVPIDTARVARNRTLITLAADVATGRPH